MDDFLMTLKQQQSFSVKTFGPTNSDRLEGCCKHIEKEVGEVRNGSYIDLEEWIDIMILAADGAMRIGYTPEQVLEAYDEKIAKNMRRTWPDWRSGMAGQPIEHDRSGEQA